MTFQKKANKKSFLERDIQLFSGFSDKKKQAFYNELGILVKSGIDLKKSFEIILEENEGEKDEEFYQNIYSMILKGKSLADSLMATGKFSEYEYYSIVIGEEANLLVEILDELKKYYKKKTDLRKQIISVLSYPVFVLTATIIIVYFLLTNLVPIFANIYEQFDSELPPITQNILYISENIVSFLLTFLGVIVGFAILVYTQKKEEWYRKLSSQIVLKIPVIGPYFKKIHIARFTNSLQLLLSANTPFIRSIELTKKMNTFYPLGIVLDDVIIQVTKGVTFHEVLKSHDFFPKRFLSLIKVGEESNELSSMLSELSVQAYDDLDHQTQVISKIMEPLMLLLIGGLVGVILVAIYQPLFNMSTIL